MHEADGTRTLSDGEAQLSPDPTAAVPSRRGARLWTVAGIVVSSAAFVVLYFFVSRRGMFTSDSGVVALQGWDYVHGNILLNGWYSADVNFYTLELPIYGLLELVFGLGPNAMHATSAVVYVLVFLAAAWSSGAFARGAAGWWRFALLAACFSVPFVHARLLAVYLELPDHFGTALFVLLAFVIYSRYARYRFAAPAALVVLVLGQLGDVTVRYVAIPAILVVWALHWLRERTLRALRGPEALIALAALLSVPATVLLRDLMKAMGAYYLSPPKSQIAPVSMWGAHIRDTLESLVGIFNVPTSDFSTLSGWATIAAVLGALVLGFALFALGRTIVRWGRADAADRLLVVAILVYLAAYAFSGVEIQGDGGGYEFSGEFAFICVLVVRVVPVPRTIAVRAPAVATAMLAALAILSTGLVASPVISTQQQLAPWLKAHGLDYGLAGYFNAAATTINSGGAVRVRAIQTVGSSVQIYAWGAKREWYDPSHNRADFVVLGPGDGGEISAQQVLAAYGSPAATYHPLPGYTVLTYGFNLLAKVTPPVLPPGA